MLNGKVNDSQRRLPSHPMRCVAMTSASRKLYWSTRNTRIIALLCGTRSSTRWRRRRRRRRRFIWHGMKLQLQLKLHWAHIDRQIQFKLRTLNIVGTQNKAKWVYGTLKSFSRCSRVPTVVGSGCASGNNICILMRDKPPSELATIEVCM